MTARLRPRRNLNLRGHATGLPRSASTFGKVDVPPLTDTPAHRHHDGAWSEGEQDRVRDLQSQRVSLLRRVSKVRAHNRVDSTQ
jgi:hypothetical protein